MKRLQTQRFFLLLTLLFCINTVMTGKSKEPVLAYDIETAGTGIEGTALVKITVYVSKVKEATPAFIKKAAVHGIIFRGVGADKGVSAQPALAKDPSLEQEKANYFQPFFAENGSYLNYATLVEGTTQVVKLSRKQYRVSAIVTVQKDRLRKDLEQADIIKGFSNLF